MFIIFNLFFEEDLNPITFIEFNYLLSIEIIYKHIRIGVFCPAVITMENYSK
jgi:hypothetical protein